MLEVLRSGVLSPTCPRQESPCKDWVAEGQTDMGMQNWPGYSAPKARGAGWDGGTWPCDAHGPEETQSSLELMERLTQLDLNWVSKGLLSGWKCRAVWLDGLGFQKADYPFYDLLMRLCSLF